MALQCNEKFELEVSFHQSKSFRHNFVSEISRMVKNYNFDKVLSPEAYHQSTLS